MFDLRKKLAYRLLYLILLIFFLNLGALLFSWHWTIWWFDMLLHFLGGAFIALALAYLTRKSIFLLLLGVLLIGIGWELFEFVLNPASFGVLDSSSDLIFDIIGGIVAIIYLSRITKLTLRAGLAEPEGRA